MKRIILILTILIGAYFSFIYGLEPVDLVINEGFDEPIKNFIDMKSFEWDTLLHTSSSENAEFLKLGLPDSSIYHSFPHSLSIDTREDGVYESGERYSFYGVEVKERLLVPKSIVDLTSFSWWHRVEYKSHEYDSVYQYEIYLCFPPDTVVDDITQFFMWVYTTDTTEDNYGEIYHKILPVPEENIWKQYEVDIHKELLEEMGVDTVWIGGVMVESSWFGSLLDNRNRGQKVWWDDIRLVGWADYNRALTRIVSGVPEKNKPYTGEVMLWNNGRERLDVSNVEMVVIKDGVDTVYQERVTKWNIESDDSVKVSFFPEWVPEEDGNYRIEFYTGYLWGKYFGDELVIDECDDDDYLFMEFTLGVKENGDRGKGIKWLKQSSKYMEFGMGITGYADIGLYDVQGRKIDDIYSGYLNGKNKITYDWRNLSKGVYFIRVEMGDKVITEKVLKVR